MWFVVLRAEISDAAVVKAIEILGTDNPDVSDLRRELVQLTQHLDELAWRIQEQGEAGEITEDAYGRAFARARAVAAVEFALGESLASCFDSLYEAYYAIDDIEVFMRIVREEDFFWGMR